MCPMCGLDHEDWLSGSKTKKWILIYLYYLIIIKDENSVYS